MKIGCARLQELSGARVSMRAADEGAQLVEKQVDRMDFWRRRFPLIPLLLFGVQSGSAGERLYIRGLIFHFQLYVPL